METIWCSRQRSGRRSRQPTRHPLRRDGSGGADGRHLHTRTDPCRPGELCGGGAWRSPACNPQRARLREIKLPAGRLKHRRTAAHRRPHDRLRAWLCSRATAIRRRFSAVGSRDAPRRTKCLAGSRTNASTRDHPRRARPLARCSPESSKVSDRAGDCRSGQDHPICWARQPSGFPRARRPERAA